MKTDLYFVRWGCENPQHLEDWTTWIRICSKGTALYNEHLGEWFVVSDSPLEARALERDGCEMVTLPRHALVGSVGRDWPAGKLEKFLRWVFRRPEHRDPPSTYLPLEPPRQTVLLESIDDHLARDPDRKVGILMRIWDFLWWRVFRRFWAGPPASTAREWEDIT